jgi:hypothetical protein
MLVRSTFCRWLSASRQKVGPSHLRKKTGEEYPRPFAAPSIVDGKR